MENPTKMKVSLNDVVNTKLQTRHFLISLVSGFILTSLLYIFLIPLTFWGIFGEGEVGYKDMDKPIYSFIQEFGALAITLSINAILIALNYNKHQPHKIKSLILSGIVLSVMYIFRVQIGNSIIELCKIDETKLTMYDKDILERAHKSCSSHRQELENSRLCGCFYCLVTFQPKEITEYFEENLNKGETALCPNCGIDSVLSDKFPITDKSF